MAWQTDGGTPLHGASYSGHVECVRALLEGGAAINQAAVGCAGSMARIAGAVGVGLRGRLRACMRSQLVGCAGKARVGGYGREVIQPMPYFRSWGSIAIMGCSRRVNALVRPGMTV